MEEHASDIRPDIEEGDQSASINDSTNNEPQLSGDDDLMPEHIKKAIQHYRSIMYENAKAAYETMARAEMQDRAWAGPFIGGKEKMFQCDGEDGSIEEDLQILGIHK